MKRHIIKLLLFMATFMPHGLAYADDVTISEPKIDAAVASYMQKKKIPGVALAIIHRGKVVLMKGYGEANVELHVPVTPDTIFQSGSVGKQFTAAAILTLVDAGKLSLDDTIGKFWPDAPAWWKPITVRQLLTHTSGMPNHEIGQIDLRKDYTDEEFIQECLKLRPAFAPGSRWSYSNPGFVMLGCIVGKVTGKHYSEQLKDYVFKPADMKTARVISEADIVPNRAAGYQLAKGELKNQDWVSPSLNTTGDGALYFTLRDLIAWEEAIRAGKVLNPATWKEMFTPVTLTSGKTYPYGFAWWIDQERGQPRQHHGGAWQGFRTFIARYLKDDLTILLLTNLAEAEPDLFTDVIAAAIDPKLGQPNTPLPENDPARAERVRELLAKAKANRMTAEDFIVLPAGYFPMLANHLSKLLEPLGEPQKLELLEQQQRGDDRACRYRVAYQDKRLEVTLQLAPNGKVVWFMAKPVE